MKHRNERGEVVVEASIIVTLVVILITVMLYIAMILYQQTLVSVIANRTASNIAQVYSNSLKDPFTGYVDPDQVYQSVTYSNMKTDAYMDVIEQKANVLAQYRLKSSRILTTGVSSVEVEVVKKPNELLKSQIVVTITDKYDVPLVGFFGADSLVEFSASGRADCVDILEYINGVEAIGNPEESSVPSLPDSDTCIVTFIINKYDGGFHAAVPVLRGKTILSSNHLSHSTMPANPKFNNLKFTGWVTESGVPFNASTVVNSHMTIYGNWQCKVTLDPTGGSVSPTSFDASYKKPATLPTPTRSGYEFKGWFTEKNGNGTRYYSNVTEITSDITLYAHWRCTHDFTLVREVSPTCRQRHEKHYKCVRCPQTKEEYGGTVGHNMVCTASGGMGCTSYAQYSCTWCGNGYRTGGGSHNFGRRCNVSHPTNSFRCTTANYNYCGTKSMHHITCANCYLSKKTNVTQDGVIMGSYVYWCGLHASGVPTTPCRG